MAKAEVSIVGTIIILKERQIINGNNNQKNLLGFSGGTVVKNPPANAGNTDSNPGPGRSHMPWSN